MKNNSKYPQPMKNKQKTRRASALILAIVITSLLAIIAATFIMTSRVDRMATSSIASNKTLDYAIESVINKISQTLVEDLLIENTIDPNITYMLNATYADPNRNEYWDYPSHRVENGPDGILGTADDTTIAAGTDGIPFNADDPSYAELNWNRLSDPWLATLEPEYVDYAADIKLSAPMEIGFRHITDLYGTLQYLWTDSYDYASDSVIDSNLDSEDERISFRNMRAVVIDPLEPIAAEGHKADADGDGVADSRWVKIPNTTHKAKDIYTAIRIIDNAAMINLNIAYKFDPLDSSSRIDGRSQTQVNLMGLTERGITNSPAQEEESLNLVRTGNSTINFSSYDNNVIWNYGNAAGSYTPFDISDELELRNRFFLKQQDASTRTKGNLIWTKVFRFGESIPVDDPDRFQTDPSYWFTKVNNSSLDVNDYDYRHICTTYNMDRVVDANNGRMANAALSDPCNIFISTSKALAQSGIYNTPLAAQMAVNIRDYADNDSNVSIISTSDGDFYGFERPCVFLSELVVRSYEVPPAGPTQTLPIPIYRSFGIELRKRYPAQNNSNWRILVDDVILEDPNATDALIEFTNDTRRYLVFVFESNDINTKLEDDVAFSDSPADGETDVDPDVILSWPPLPFADPGWKYDIYFGNDQNSVANASRAVDPNVDLKSPPGGQSDEFFDPDADLLGVTYYWRIDDVNDGGEVVLKGDVMSFTTWTQEPNLVYGDALELNEVIFVGESIIELQREVATDDWLTVDSVMAPSTILGRPATNDGNSYTESFQRDISHERWIKRLWDFNEPTLGHYNQYEDDANAPLIARPANDMHNIGELSLILKKSAYLNPDSNPILYADTESDAKIDITLPEFHPLFNYLTVIDPVNPEFNKNFDLSEMRVKGRININTAPPFVLAQLPWLSHRINNLGKDSYYSTALAEAIVAYRDKLHLTANLDYAGQTGRRDETLGPLNLREDPGFASIGELSWVIDANVPFDDNYSIRWYEDGNDQMTYPDLTHGAGGRNLGDKSIDDFEERDLIFARISNLITVRSDVFTAYILVRMGKEGPQKRVIAIFDRSEVYSPKDKPKILAIHPVPDPR